MPAQPEGHEAKVAGRRWQQHIPLLASLFLLAAWYRPVFGLWRIEWFADTGYYSHGPMVPILAGILIWLRRDSLAAARISPSFWGVLVVLLGAMVKVPSTWISHTGTEAFASVSLPVVLWGIVLALYGWQVARILAGPIAFLWLMCPLPGPLFRAFSGPMQLWSTQLGAAMMSALGVDLRQEGTVIHLGELSLFVETACSGFKSVLALMTLTAFAAGTSRLRRSFRAVLLVSGLPIGLMANATRIGIITGVASHWGEAGAQKAHDYSGLILLGLACLGVLGLTKVLVWWDKSKS